MASSPKTSYRIVNPGAGDDYYNASGTAFDSKGDFTDSKNPSSQPTYVGGSARNLYSNRTLLDAVAKWYDSGVYGSKVVTGNYIGSAAWGDAATADSVAASASGYLVVTDVAHGLVVGDTVNLTDTSSVVNGPQRVTAKTANTFTTTKPYSSGAGTVTWRKHANTRAGMVAGQYVMRRYCSQLAGAANTTLRSGTSYFKNSSNQYLRRAIHQVEAVRTTRTCTAIKAGYWNEFSGTWSTTPTSANDISTWETNGTDDAANPTRTKPGELVYKEPKPVPQMKDYSAKNT